MKLDFWLDPVCPWCWLTSRWIVDITPHRDLDVTWRPISLKIKNQLTEESPFYARASHTLGLLRVMESVRATEGAAAIGGLYAVFGEHIHHRQDSFVDAAQTLAEAGLPSSHAGAFNDESWDPIIRAQMDEGLALTGNDVGTPLLAFTPETGPRVGFFGPVISRRLALDAGLRLWDGLLAASATDGFWELKRTRSEGPDFTQVPTT
jgi:hypothetical protein